MYGSWRFLKVPTPAWVGNELDTQQLQPDSNVRYFIFLLNLAAMPQRRTLRSNFRKKILAPLPGDPFQWAWVPIARQP